MTEAVTRLSRLPGAEVSQTSFDSKWIIIGVPVALVTGRPLAVPDARAALSTSLAFGGSTAALDFRRWVDP